MLHDERCRARIEELIKENEPERYEKALERVCRTEICEDRGVKNMQSLLMIPLLLRRLSLDRRTLQVGPAPVRKVAW